MTAPPRIELGPEHSVAVVGMKGTGKTTLFRQLLTLPGAPARRAVWDPLHQYPADVAYRPGGMVEPRAEMDLFLRQAYGGPPTRVFIEEAEAVLPERYPFLPNTQAFLQMGRNRGHSVVVNTRRPAMLHKFLLEEADHVFLFKMRNLSLKAVIDVFDLEPGDEAKLRTMRRWQKEDHRFFWLNPAGELVECPPLKLPRAPAPAPVA